MSITFQAQTTGTSSGSTTLAFSSPAVSLAGSLGIVTIFVQTDLTINTVTWGASSCIFIGGVTLGGVERIEMWYVLNPPTSATVTITRTGNTNGIQGRAAVYTGAKQSGQPNTSTTKSDSSVTSSTVTVITSVDKAFIIMVSRGGATLSAGTGTTIRGTYTSTGLFDSNGDISPAGSTSLQTTASSTDIVSVMAAFAPLPDAIDTNVNTDSVQMGLGAMTSDTNVTTDSARTNFGFSDTAKHSATFINIPKS